MLLALLRLPRQQHMGPSVVEGMMPHVTVMVMISIIALLLEPIETARDLDRRLGGIEVVNRHRVAVIVLCMVISVMIAMAKAVIMAAVLEQLVAVGMASVREVQKDSVGAQVRLRDGEQSSRCQFQVRSGFNMMLL